MNLPIVKLRNVWLGLSGIIVVASVVALATWGLKFGIDFTGGSLMEVRLSQLPETSAVAEAMAGAGLEDVTVQTSDSSTLFIRSKSLDEPTHQAALAKLNESFGAVEELRFDSIGPVIGNELRRKSLWGVGVTLVLIGLYIAWAFRKVSEPVQSWKYGLLTVFTAFHDVLVPLGLFAVMGHYFGWEVGTAFIAAVLTILGYSITDTVVVFDRTRENLTNAHMNEKFEDIVNRSINQTAVRSFNTSITTLLALTAIAVWGGESTRPFAVALIAGIATGTYSSIFLASPLLVVWNRK